jgi:hypothetical protein
MGLATLTELEGGASYSREKEISKANDSIIFFAVGYIFLLNL